MPNRKILIATAVFAIIANVKSTIQLQPVYSPVSVELEDDTYKYRSMPSLQHVQWTDVQGQQQQRFIRSFQVGPDGGTLITRIEYHIGGELNKTSNWKPALDATTGRLLSNTTDQAKVNNFFVSTDNSVVVIDEVVHLATDNTSLFVMRRESSDGGRSWTSASAPVDVSSAAVLPGKHYAGRVFQQVIRLPDSSLVTPFCADWTKAGGEKAAAHLLVSTNEGKSWKLAATLFQSTEYGWSESTVVQRSDGELLMISRYDVTEDGVRFARLAYRVTHQPVDSVQTLETAKWSPVSPIIVPGAADYPKQVQGVAPLLFNIKDGILLLAFGRPRNKLTVSYDGGHTWPQPHASTGITWLQPRAAIGHTWLTAHSFYDNIPNDCRGSYGGNPCTSLGSSGYMGLAVTGPTSVQVIGDNCHTNWGCRPDFSYPHGRGYQLWFARMELK